MKIYTSYFAMLKKIPEDMVPISIAISTPKWYQGECYKKIAPDYFMVENLKKYNDIDRYKKEYWSKIKHLTVQGIVNDLKEISNGKDVVLLCYEKPTDFCHRHLIAKWFEKENITVKELEF